MSSSVDFKDFILDQLRDLDDINCRAMMGEFVLYYKGIVFGGIYDDRFLIKRTETNQKYKLSEEIPYPGGKPMFMVDNLDDSEYLSELIKITYGDLMQNKKA